jgi:hypothetical protein
MRAGSGQTFVPALAQAIGWSERGASQATTEEELLLLGAFGPVYADSCRRTKRIVGGLY